MKLGHMECSQRGKGRLFWCCGSCRKRFDAMTWSFLPRLRCPLPWIVKIMEAHFASAQTVSTQDLGRALVTLFFFAILQVESLFPTGHRPENKQMFLSILHPAGWLRLSGSHGGLLKRCVAALRKAEAHCATYWQRDHPLAGDVEVDATSLRKFKIGGGSRLSKQNSSLVSATPISFEIWFDHGLFRLVLDPALRTCPKRRDGESAESSLASLALEADSRRSQTSPRKPGTDLGYQGLVECPATHT